MRCIALLPALLAAAPVLADVVVPARTIRAQDLIGSADLALHDAEVAGGFSDPSVLVGLEARVTLYPGRPIRSGDVGPPAVVERNQMVTLIYEQSGLTIMTEGRALGRGAAGEMVRAMNLSSRTTVSGMIRLDGQIEVK